MPCLLRSAPAGRALHACSDSVCCPPRLLPSFDSADLDEEDPDEGVGVDERAASLQPEDFFLDDEDWYASARWVLERPQTEDFITTALLTHMAPLYVPYADVRARTPKDVVPIDVQVRACRDLLRCVPCLPARHSQNPSRDRRTAPLTHQTSHYRHVPTRSDSAIVNDSPSESLPAQCDIVVHAL